MPLYSKGEEGTFGRNGGREEDTIVSKREIIHCSFEFFVYLFGLQMTSFSPFIGSNAEFYIHIENTPTTHFKRVLHFSLN